jgi:hypothetical protein
VSGVADALETQALWNEFHRVVNMTSQELSAWLRVSEAGEHAEPLPDQAGAPIGRHVLAILQKRRTDLTDDDIRVMHKVVELVERAEDENGPENDVVRRRDRLMTLGHDPLRAG